ncbi:GntR family transcriptional regulator [Reichenbachiella versicolor]|uniref:GntR family transcriptional regulator n=1 Tax=Reichenbachiella versicolor TaxID=1821036 RepID=UPI000D6E337B|nr:GntR family transcriptional regulator [Reichenbachiella versicolor]
MEHLELVDRIYAKVKQMIFNQELKQGQKIVQEKLAAELGVSRSPLLKALQRLDAEMLVESIPRRGMYVKSIDMDELVDIFECRAVLEGLSARLVAQRITPDRLKKLKACFKPFEGKSEIKMEAYAKADRQFHSLILDWSGNKVIGQLEVISNVHLRAMQAGLLRSPEETLSEHQAIIEAIENQDGERAEAEMRNHIVMSIEDAIQTLSGKGLEEREV